MTKKQADEILRILSEGGYLSSRKKDKGECQYRGHDERYCNATQNTNCEKCKFFTPTLHAKNRMLMEEIVRHEGEEARKDKLIRERDLMVLNMTREIGEIEDELEATIEKYERELRRAVMVREFIRRWWHG